MYITNDKGLPTDLFRVERSWSTANTASVAITINKETPEDSFKYRVTVSSYNT